MEISYQGELTYLDTKKHIKHHFELPAGATFLHITFDYSPERATDAEYANQVSLSLFDPDGFRGARHNNVDQTIRLSRAEATPGYIAGDLPAGDWTVIIDTHRILPPDPLHYDIQVRVGYEPIEASPIVYAKGTTTPRGVGWYRGDLHGHTYHSDASWDVQGFVQYARDYHLDFVTLTDHNTISALAEIDSLSSDDVLTMGGMELTTYYGHALALGTRQWYEWRLQNGQTMRELAQAVIESGALYVIAHPRSAGDPSCTGCRWEFEDMMPGIAPAVEIWNEEWSSHNQDGLELYYQWLNEGHHLVATAGTDIHGGGQGHITDFGFNVVYADELSEVAILDAIRKGHLYLSSEPTLNLTAECGEVEVMMGDTLDRRDDTVRLNVAWDRTQPDDTVRLVVNGDVTEHLPTETAGHHTWILDSSAKWVVIEIRRPDGDLRAITNPIWIV